MKIIASCIQKPGLLLGKQYLRFAVKGDLYMKGKAAVGLNFPIRHIGPAGTVKPALHASQTDFRKRCDFCLPEAGGSRRYSGCITVQKLHHAAIGIVVQAVHAGAADGSVRKNAVPPLPNGRRSEIDGIQPSGKALIKQQIVGLVRHSVLREHAVHHRRSYEAALQTVQILPEAFLETGQDSLFVHIDTKLQCRQIAGLGIHSKPPGGGKILVQNGFANVLRPMAVFVRLRLL